MGANEVERRAGEQQEDGNRENVRVEVRETRLQNGYSLMVSRMTREVAQK